jgi:signal transduction histidine kinase
MIDQWLERMRLTWFERVTNALSNIPGIQDSFLEPVSLFSDALFQAVLNEDPASLEPVLKNWIEALTLAEIYNQDTAIITILNTFFQQHVDLAKECLEPGDAVHLIQKLLPAYSHAIEFSYRNETIHKIDHIVEELEQANELVKRVEKSKADFISVAAHELKTPLTLIEGYSSMLDEHLATNGADSLTKQYLQGIEIGYKRLRDIVEDMIAVTMIDNNILTIHYQPVWIYRLFDIIASEVEGILSDRDITLSITRLPELEEMSYADGERLLQAFRKLVSNAIKFTPDGGTISISGRTLPGYFEITITDTGIGIDPDDQLRIFDKFGRLGNPSLHSSSKTEFKGGGPGLGLSITKGIIEAHGGAIWVESPGYDETRYNGSTFHVILPVRKEPPDDATAQFVKRLGN